MVPRKVEELPQPVSLVKQIITTLVDYSTLKNDELKTNALVNSTINIAQLLVSVGDIYEFPNEIAKIFLKCFSQLSLQIPVVSLLLALMHRKELEVEQAESMNTNGQGDGVGEGGAVSMADDGSAAKKQFSEQLINVRLKEELLQALREGEILRARLLLRALSCLFSCNSFSPQSYLAVLSALLEAAGGGEYGNSEGEQAQNAGISPSRSSEATFLLACSIPWSIAAISALGQAQETAEEVEGLLARLEAFFRQLLGQADGSLGWAELLSPYRVGGKLEVFHTPPPPPYSGVEHFVAVDPCNTWPGQARDALFEASTFALQLISAARSNGAIPSPLSSSRCQLFPWTDADAREALSTQPFRMTTFGSHQDVQTEILAAFRTDNTANCLAGFTAGAGLSGSPSCRQGQWLSLKICVFDHETSVEAYELCELISPFDRYLAATFYTDILHNFQPIVNDDGTKLGSIDLLASHLLSVARLFPVEEGETVRGRVVSGSHLDYLLVEVIFQQLLQPPAHLSLASHAGHFKLLVHLCRRDAIFPPILALGANIAFQMNSELQPPSWRELARWFAFHLTNTKHSWPYWEFWLEELNDSLAASADRDIAGSGSGSVVIRSQGSSAAALLTHLVVDHCTRASIPEKIMKVFPVEMHTFVPQLEAPPVCPLFDRLEGGSASSAMAAATAAEEAEAAVAAASLNDRSLSSIDNTSVLAMDGEGEGEEAGSALDESMISAETNMAVIAALSSEGEAGVPTSIPMAAEPGSSSSWSGSQHLVQSQSLSQLAQKLRDMIEAKTDPEDLEDWITANRKDIWTLHLGNISWHKSYLVQWSFCIDTEDEEAKQQLDVHLSSEAATASGNSSSAEEDAIDAASANLLFQAILSVGGKKAAALSGLLGLLDRFSEVLRGVSLPENEISHAVIQVQAI